ncbi:MAG TPA: chlorite dismutase family protein [Herpetosiphonaceae bacterium]
MSNQNPNPSAPLFVQYMAFKADPAWRRMPLGAREDGRESFARAVEEAAPGIATYSYSMVGMKLDADLLLWRKSETPDEMQEMTSRLLQTGIGQYLEPTHSLFGYTRPSTYTKRHTPQEQAVLEEQRDRYFIVYPFTKTIEWYLMSKEARQGMMNEHIRVGHEYADIRQVLLYATGLDDQEFVVAYETNDLPRFQSLVIDLRSTEARRYTLRDTPILTGIHRPLREALALIG